MLVCATCQLVRPRDAMGLPECCSTSVSTRVLLHTLRIPPYVVRREANSRLPSRLRDTSREVRRVTGIFPMQSFRLEDVGISFCDRYTELLDGGGSRHMIAVPIEVEDRAHIAERNAARVIIAVACRCAAL
jgi:hypothetical protein